MALLTPGPVFEDDAFMSPDWNRLQGAAQSGGEDHWPVLWTEGTVDPAASGAFDYSGDGPDSPDWETITLDDDVVWIDETGDEWLSRHLIPFDLVDGRGHPETYGLSPATLHLMKDDIRLHRLARDAHALSMDMSDRERADWNASAMALRFQLDAANAKTAAMEAKAADLAIIASGGWTTEGKPKASTVNIVAKAAEGLEHLRAARQCFTLAGNVRTVERVRFAISSGKGAVRAASYRRDRRAGEGRTDG